MNRAIWPSLGNIIRSIFQLVILAWLGWVLIPPTTWSPWGALFVAAWATMLLWGMRNRPDDVEEDSVDDAEDELAVEFGELTTRSRRMEAALRLIRARTTDEWVKATVDAGLEEDVDEDAA